MKKAIALTLGLSFVGSTMATPVPVPVQKGYGGIQIHSSVPKAHEESLKSDIRYIYRSTHQEKDQNFLSLTGLKEINGPILHNWLINRVRFVVGEQFDIDKNIVGQRGFKYPNDLGQNAPTSDQVVATFMINLGSSLYRFGKEQNLLIQMNLDGTKVFINSPRAGILQIGEGLFHPAALLNENPRSSANAIARLGILFHEARHSDGHGKSLAFSHEQCPEGHPMANNYACEKVSNGPYATGAYSMKQLTKNCTDCSILDRLLLELKILDHLDRIIYPDNSGKIADFKRAIKSHEGIIETYSKKLANAKTKADKDTISFEIEQHKKVITNYTTLIQRLENDSKTAPAADPRPEGPVRDIPVATSKAIMERSLKAHK